MHPAGAKYVEIGRMMDKRIIINTILILLFGILGILTILPFLAEAQFNKAALLEAKYHWKDADEKLDLAIQLDPLSAEYHANMGRLYMERTVILKDKIPVLLKAEEEYKKARELNPYSARHLVALAAVKEELFLADTATYRDRLANSVDHFKEAFEKDPNNYIFNYDIGRNFLRIWDYIGEGDRQFALERFRHCLELVPWRHWRIYPKIWKKTGDFDALLKATPENLKAYENLYGFLAENNLWEYRREVTSRIKEYEEMDGNMQPSAAKFMEINGNGVEIGGNEIEMHWQGKSASGENTYKDGKMCWTGTVHRAIDLPKGETIIKIQAKGSQAYDIWPYMIVELDGEEVWETFVDSSEWKKYSFNVNTNGGLKVLSVTFPNDGGDWKKGIDRNLYLGEVDIEIR